MNRAAIILLTISAAVSAPSAFAAGSGGASGLPASSRPAVDPAAAYQEGVEALKAKDYKKAEKKFGDVLSVAPENPEANYYMALAKIGNGKQKNSIRFLEKAIKERANFVEAREKLALVSIDLGDAETARAQLTAIEGLKADCAAAGDCEDAYNARVDLAITRINEALSPPAAEPTSDAAPAGDAAPVEDQQSSLFFAPRDEGVARYMAAVRLINEAKYEGAIADLLMAQASVGPHPDILNYLGFSHRKLGMMDKAQDYYAQALRLDPDHKGANEYLGELYLEIGDLRRAKTQLAKLDAICRFGCAEREDLARLIERREGALAAN
ncbi:MAG: hypothetical protein A3E78_05235 [Alphaproteobacteria bacterium RIFCSPHIGHO2_12_FULL_63_12]|nr:MAG: hypothetical protein A3E78_05235 [Alphaproteobacteria bacterium RIFCSPHIGHO2_12_FULL_63_12]